MYTAVTFSPVQDFIERSRKLRDLCGSSYLLSLLSWSVCQDAISKGHTLITPARINISQGIPNLILVRSKSNATYLPEDARYAFFFTWQTLLDTCRYWIEEKNDSGVYNVTRKEPWKKFQWKRPWNLISSHAWEFFAVTGEESDDISDMRCRLNDIKQERAWVGVNFGGESSTLSGVDAIAWPLMDKDQNAMSARDIKDCRISFYANLSQGLGRAFINEIRKDDPKQEKNWEGSEADLGQSFIEITYDSEGKPISAPEQLSIPELVKRLITHKAISRKFLERYQRQLNPQTESQGEGSASIDSVMKEIENNLSTKSFRELNRLPQKDKTGKPKPVHYTGWFMGDGDGAGKYLTSLNRFPREEEEDKNIQFSSDLLDWGQEFSQRNSDAYEGNKRPDLAGSNWPGGRVIYAGGDDFLGVIYRPNEQVQPKDCAKWLSHFESAEWNRNGPQNLTASMGFVWTAPKISQRDVLQHCREAEHSAKRAGRSRVAIRLLFAGGNWLEWICPWQILSLDALENKDPSSKTLFDSICDANGNCTENGRAEIAWTHFLNDVNALRSRHAFDRNSIDIATSLFSLYFPSCSEIITSKYWWNSNQAATASERRFGILGNPKGFAPNEFATAEEAFSGDVRPEFLTPDHLADPTIQYDINQAINEWVIHLAEVGFHLCRTISNT